MALGLAGSLISVDIAVDAEDTILVANCCEGIIMTTLLWPSRYLTFGWKTRVELLRFVGLILVHTNRYINSRPSLRVRFECDGDVIFKSSISYPVTYGLHVIKSVDNFCDFSRGRF